jgi:hypothetical protein
LLVPEVQQAWAQLLQPSRFEKEQKYSESEFEVISLKEQGLALLRDKNKYKSGNQTWEIIFLDSLLAEKRTVEMEVDQRKALIGHEYSQGYFYALYQYGETQRITLDLMEVNIASGETRKYEIKPELALQLSHFSKVGDNFVFGGYVNSEPAVVVYNPALDNLKVLPGFFQKETELVDLRTNANYTFNVILIDRHQRNNRKVTFKIFDSSGKELLEDAVVMEDKRSLQTGISSELVREDLMILGTWGSTSSRQSSGFYALPVDPFSDQKINYMAFGELSHYLDHLKPPRAEAIKEKTQNDLRSGRIPDYVNYVMPFKLVEHAEGFLLLVEVFTPSSTFSNTYPDDPRLRTNPYYNPYYNPFWGYTPSPYNRTFYPYYGSGSTVQNTDEVKISRTVLLAFDEKGQLRWDHQLELDNIRRSSLEQIADFCVADHSIIFLYKKESELKMKSIALETSEAKEWTEKIKLPGVTDELRMERERDGTVKHWYGKSFFVWGYQTIHDRAKPSDANRQVFYINKITLP